MFLYQKKRGCRSKVPRLLFVVILSNACNEKFEDLAGYSCDLGQFLGYKLIGRKVS